MYAYVEVAGPLQDGGIVLLGLAQQCGLLVLRLLRGSASLSRWRGGRSSGGVVAYGYCAGLANTSRRRIVKIEQMSGGSCGQILCINREVVLLQPGITV